MDESAHNTPSKPASEGTLMASIMNPSQPNQITTYEEAMDSLEEGSVVRTSSPQERPVRWARPRSLKIA